MGLDVEFLGPDNEPMFNGQSKTRESLGNRSSFRTPNTESAGLTGLEPALVGRVRWPLAYLAAALLFLMGVFGPFPWREWFQQNLVVAWVVLGGLVGASISSLYDAYKRAYWTARYTGTSVFRNLRF